MIDGLLPHVKMLSDFVPEQVYRQAQRGSKPFWLAIFLGGDGGASGFDGNGLSLAHLFRYFQLNWRRSLDGHDSDPASPMSHQLYVGFYYHDSDLPREKVD